MRYPIFLACSLLLSACAHRERVHVADRVPFDQRLIQFQALHNDVRIEELRPFFTKDARIQSPLTPRAAGAEKYLQALAAEPYHLGFSGTQVIYSLPRRAATRSDVVASASGRFNLKERVTIDWRVESGYWRIARILFLDWSPVIGTWRRSGLRQEGSVELRVLPDGNYLVYLAGDYSAPGFRGRYRLEGNRIFFEDISSSDPRQLQSGEGSYIFVTTAAGIEMRKMEDENSWRAERFEGVWSAAR
ncbi:MAG TPA: hypothetical protein VIS96_05270 [Terrimicrobiaceae bacterium]